MAADDDLLAGRPVEVFCQARDALSHDVREYRRGLTLTAWWAPDAQHLPRGALLMQSMFCASNSARLAPANAPAKHIIMHSDAFRTTWRAHVRCSQVRTSGVRDGEPTPGIFRVRQRSELSSPSFRGVRVEPAFEVQSRESNPVRRALNSPLRRGCGVLTLCVLVRCEQATRTRQGARCGRALCAHV